VFRGRVTWWSAVVIGELGGAEHDTCTGINAVPACGCLGTAISFEVIREGAGVLADAWAAVER